jgi:hypothetical protein
MKDCKRLVRETIWAMVACLCASPLSAQQEGGERPKPATQVLMPFPDLSNNQQDINQGTQTMQPDIGPVTGIQNPTLGTTEMRHSYWVPGIRYSNAIRSNSSNPITNPGWNSTSYVSGDLSALEAWSHSLLSLNYSGGGFSSTDDLQGNGHYHQFAAAYEIDQGRWQVLLVDQLSYLPESAFGFGGMSGLALAGITGSLAVPLPGLQQLFVPGQTILTATGPRYSNAGAAQLTFELSPRGSITVAGVQGLLRFTNTGNINNDTTIFSGGYNYVVTRKDTVGLVYLFSAYRYPGASQALGDHVAQFVYGRKITGRLALRLGGGPEITTFRVPINGSVQRISGGGNASLTYAFHRSNIALSYLHGVSNGSGVFTGASTDLASSTWNRQLTRVWSGNLNFGYAKNTQILGKSGLTSPNFDSWVAGAGLSRPLGRTANLSLAYQALIQGSNVALCQGPNCGTNYTQHQIFLSFEWHARPIVLR